MVGVGFSILTQCVAVKRKASRSSVFGWLGAERICSRVACVREPVPSPVLLMEQLQVLHPSCFVMT